MKFDAAILSKLTISVDVTGYVRIVPSVHASTPLGVGFGKTRFASPRDKFKLLYLAVNPTTAIAETIVRDRFQGKAHRRMTEEEFRERSIAEIVTAQSLTVVDLRGKGATLLNVPTDTAQAKNQSAGRTFSQKLYDETSLDGIVYSSRLTGEDCIAIYDRAVHKLTPSAAIDLTTLPTLSTSLADLEVQVLRI